MVRPLRMSEMNLNESTTLCSGGDGAFSLAAKIWGESSPISRLRFFFESGNQLAHTNSALYARIGPQWLRELRRL